jgi:hypothetical protein
MRLTFSLLASALLCISNMAARADIITNFTLTHGSDTIQFSISDSTPPFASYQSPGIFSEIDYRVSLTVDGIEHVTATSPGDLGVEGFESLQSPGVGAEFYVGYRTGFVDGVAQYQYYFEQGIQIFTYVDGAIVYTPGTYIFPEVVTVDYAYPAYGDQTSYGSDDELVITQTDTSVSAVPEPSAFVLFGTGLIGAMGVIRRRLTC